MQTTNNTNYDEKNGQLIPYAMSALYQMAKIAHQVKREREKSMNQII